MTTPAPQPLIDLLAAKRGDERYRRLHATRRTPLDIARPTPAILLRTCERLETYTDLGTHQPDHLPHTPDATERAARHLFRVAAGLDSRLTGETHVLGQVRNALKQAHELGTSSPTLTRLFERAIRVGRKVRATTPLGDIAADFGPLAAEHLLERLGDRANARVAVIGSGAVARDTIAALRRRGVERLTVFARHTQRAADAIDRAGLAAAARVRELADLPAAARTLDAIVTATSSPRALVTPATIEAGETGQTRDRPLTVIDLGEPPNADPAVAATDRVALVTMDDLASAFRGRAVSVRAEAVELAARAVEAEAAAWLDSERRRLSPASTRTANRRCTIA